MSLASATSSALARAWRAFRGVASPGEYDSPQVEMTRALCEQIAVLSTYAAGFRGVPTVFAEGQLPVLEAAQYTVPTGYNAIVTLIQCNNNGSTTETVVLSIRPGSTSREFIRAELLPDETVEWTGDMPLEAGDVIRGKTTSATTVDFTLHGYLVPV